MTGLVFADTKVGQRVIGNKLPKNQYEVPAGWADDGVNPTWTGKVEKQRSSVLLLLQPDRSLDLKPTQWPAHTYIRDFKRTEELVEVLQKQSAEELQELMDLGRKMAKSHLERFQGFERFPAKQACLLLGGEALQAADFSEADGHFADAHLRILSGLYGLLRPYDDVKPVRDVPMGARLNTKRGRTLCEFWGDSITKQIAKDAAELSKRGDEKVLLVACVSDEYWRAVQASALPSSMDVIRVAFEGATEENVRRARGLFARHVIRKRVSDLEGLQDFSHDDWAFDRASSRESKLVFNWDGDPAGGTAPKKLRKLPASNPGYHSSGSSGGEAEPQEVQAAHSGSRSPSPRSRSRSRRAATRRKACRGRCSSSRSRGRASGQRRLKRDRGRRGASSRSGSGAARRRRRA
mmetsp:Transcript_31562/g.100635  ORF Transcript_31562/g.100635 Transcript_31562/m.100635 type:complete len:407 (-) Transcript_31562:121-1341(-)